jgi:hypothetical protein
MTTQDNAYRATGTGNPHVDFFAIPGDNTQPAPIWGFLTRDNRFGIGGSFDGFVYGVEGHGGHPDDNGKTGPDYNDYSSHAGVIGSRAIRRATISAALERLMIEKISGRVAYAP